MNPLYLLIRLGFGVVFLYAAVSKVAYPAAFAQIIGNYQILPDMLVNPVALLLPWAEVVCGLALVTGVFTRAAALTLNLMLVVFIAALWFNVSRGLDVACGCFSVSDKSAGGMRDLIVRDVALLAVGVVVMSRAFAQERCRQASKTFWTSLKEPFEPRQQTVGSPVMSASQEQPSVVGLAAQAAAQAGSSGSSLESGAEDSQQDDPQAK